MLFFFTHSGWGGVLASTFGAAFLLLLGLGRSAGASFARLAVVACQQLNDRYRGDLGPSEFAELLKSFL